MTISFIIPVHNGLEFTKACLQSLHTDAEIIVVDDASTDGTAEYLATLPVRVIRNPVRRSYAANNNAAARMATGEFLCLLNNDVVLRPGWLAPMLHAFEKFPRAGIVGNIQRNPRTKLYDHMGIVFADDGMPWHYGKHFYVKLRTGYTAWRAVTTACALIRREVFLEAGGFDETYINGSEDIDLCLRLAQRGYRHYVANESVVDHFVSSSPGRHAYNTQNQTLLLQRWRDQIVGSLTPQDRLLFAANYINRYLTEPSRYNGPLLWNSIQCLLTCGR